MLYVLIFVLFIYFVSNYIYTYLMFEFILYCMLYTDIYFTPACKKDDLFFFFVEAPLSVLRSF